MSELHIENDANLQSLNTMAVPASADKLVSVFSINELKAALDYAQVHELAVFILGEGSNTIFKSDVNGLVILNRIKGIDLLEESSEHVLLKVGAGENWHSFVSHCVDSGWYGLENLALIPGLVGAAPIQNIGAYGVEVKSSIVELDLIELSTRGLKTLSSSDCDFAYRDSVFKNSLKNKVIITSVTFKLSKKAVASVSYPALAAELGEDPTPKQVFDAVCKVRSAKLPDPAQIPNTGSFFKNPLISEQLHGRLQTEFPGLVSFPVGNEYKLAAAWLIERAGWKDQKDYSVEVHQDQSLVVINPLRQSGEKVIEFAMAIQEDIHKKFDVMLEIEPRIFA